jgi:hypothetical protein
MEADDVLATRSTLRASLAWGRPSSLAADSMIREFAWWATKRSRSSTVRSAACSA